MAKDEIVEAEPEGPKSDMFLTGLVVFTSVALVVALFTIWYAHGHTYLMGPLKP